MKKQWTPEPWHCRNTGYDPTCRIYGRNYAIATPATPPTANPLAMDGSREAKANADRIVGCVNGCRDIPKPEGISSLIPATKALLKMYIAGVNSGDWGNWNPETDDEVIAVRQALRAMGLEP